MKSSGCDRPPKKTTTTLELLSKSEDIFTELAV